MKTCRILILTIVLVSMFTSISMARYLTPDPIGLAGGINPYVYVENDPINSVDPLGLYRSNPFLRGAVPGQVFFDYGMTSMENGNFGMASFYFSGMVGEQILFALTLGQGVAARGASVCEMGVAGEVSSGLAGNSLIGNALQPFKGQPLTMVGRALTKHPEVVGLTKETLRQSLSTDPLINDAATKALSQIVGNGVRTTLTIPRYGSVVQYQLPGGFGARWYGAGERAGEFIGFINP